jgi:hypothetical protein
MIWGGEKEQGRRAAKGRGGRQDRGVTGISIQSRALGCWVLEFECKSGGNGEP